MDTNRAPLLADIFLHSYEAKFIQSLLSTGKNQLASRFHLTYRYIDNVLSINNPELENYLGQMSPAELEIKDITESITSASYLDLILSIGRDGQLHTFIYDKRYDFNSLITNYPFLNSNVPSSPAYGVFISQLTWYARMNVLLWGPGDCPVNYSNRNYSWNAWNRHSGIFYGRYGNFIQQYEAPSHKWQMTFWSLPSYSDSPTDQTFLNFHTELELHRITSGFYGAFATGVACQQGTLTLPDTWSRPPFLLQFLRPDFTNFPCLYSTFHIEFPLVLSRFCFDAQTRQCYLWYFFDTLQTVPNDILTNLDGASHWDWYNVFMTKIFVCWIFMTSPLRLAVGCRFL